MSKRGIPAPRSEPTRSNRPRAVAELVPEIGRVAFRRFGFVQSSVVSRWPEIVGDRYAAVSAPESIRFPRGERSGGTLNLVVRGAFAGVMQHVAPEIVARVNRFFGYDAVARLSIRQGEVVRERAPTPVAAPRALPADLGGSVRGIADPELRAVLEALAAGVAASRGAPQIAESEA